MHVDIIGYIICTCDMRLLRPKLGPMCVGNESQEPCESSACCVGACAKINTLIYTHSGHFWLTD